MEHQGGGGVGGEVPGTYKNKNIGPLKTKNDWL